MDDADDDVFMAPIGGANSTPVPSSSDNKAPSTAVQLPDEEDDGFMSPVVAPKPISDGKDNTATNSTMGALTSDDARGLHGADTGPERRPAEVSRGR